MYHPFIVGNKVYLRGIEKQDLSGPFFQWANDEAVTKYLFMGIKPNILENLVDWFDEIGKSDKEVVMMVVDKKSDKVIGLCGLHEIRWVSRSAEYRVFVGEKEFWGKGYGQEITKLVVRYGFEKLNMNKIWLGVNAEHIGAVKSYEKSGFVNEGVLRQEIYRNSKYYDAVRMSILREEYYNRLKSQWDKEIPNPGEQL